MIFTSFTPHYTLYSHSFPYPHLSALLPPNFMQIIQNNIKYNNHVLIPIDFIVSPHGGTAFRRLKNDQSFLRNDIFVDEIWKKIDVIKKSVTVNVTLCRTAIMFSFHLFSGIKRSIDINARIWKSSPWWEI